MAIRPIVFDPQPVLRQSTQPVERFDDDLQTLIDDMFETMYDAPGVGLAAPQIGISLRLCVIDCSREKNQPLVLINPTILSRSEPTTYQEGCLSIPGAYSTVTRDNKIRFQALDRNGETYEMDAEGLLAECVQHELDHLDGKLYLDRISMLKRQRARTQMQKYLRQLKKRTS